MKNLIFFLLVSTMCFAQSIKVENVTLTYNQKNKTMVILIPPKCLEFPTNDKKLNVRITRDYDLVMVKNGIQHSVGDNYFAFSGFTRPTYSKQHYENTKNCKWSQDYNFLFQNVEKGEYILTVTITCDDNTMVTTKKKSIIIP